MMINFNFYMSGVYSGSFYPIRPMINNVEEYKLWERTDNFEDYIRKVISAVTL